MLNDGQAVLVTGGTGYLGSRLVKQLVAQGKKVVLLKRETSPLNRIEKVYRDLTVYNTSDRALHVIFEENNIAGIVHCATNYGRSSPNPLEILEANLHLPLQLLELAKTYRVKYFLNTDTLLDKRVNFYSLSKKQFGEWLKLYSEDLICANVALEHFFGPGDDGTKFVSFVVQNLLKNSPALDFTPGDQKRDFIFIDDVVSAFLKIISHCESQKSGYLHFEIGSGKNISVREFVEKVKELSKNQVTQLNFGVLPYRENEVMESKVDLRALCTLNWSPIYSLEQGLKLTIENERQELSI